MAFDWLGTFNRSQYDRFKAFVQAQLGDIAARVLHLQYEKLRIGKLSFSYDKNGTPTSYDTGGKYTYIGKLIAAYEVLGGNAQFDLNLRTRDQAVFLITASELTPPMLMSNGEIMGQPGLNDLTSANLIQSSRAWMPGVLDYKREYLERKIRRAIDYADQLQAEIDQLGVITGDVSVKGSLANTLKAIEDLFHDKGYRAIYDDNKKDPFGKLTYSPFKPYSDEGTKPGDREPTDIYGRDDSGAMVPGETKA